MDLSKIKILIDFVGQSKINELTVTENGTTLRIFRTGNPDEAVLPLSTKAPQVEVTPPAETTFSQDVKPDTLADSDAISSVIVTAPIFGVLHRSPGPGERAFVELDDEVEAGQTLIIIEAMKVFNKIAAPRAGRVVRLTNVDGGEVEAGDMLVEIA